MKIKALIAIIILLVIGGTGFYFGGSYIKERIKGAPEEKIPQQNATGTQENNTKDEMADWKIYKSEMYGFQMKYPPDIFFEPEQASYATVLLSFSTTTVGEGEVNEVNIKIGEVETSSIEDVNGRIKGRPASWSIEGPVEEKIGEASVYIATFRLDEGKGNVIKIYYFPEFTLNFIFTNSDSENKFKVVEQKMFSTISLFEPKKPYVKVVFPKGGETLEIGKTYEILWEYQGVKSVDIILENWKVVSGNWPASRFIARNIPAADGKYSFKLSMDNLPPESREAGNLFKVRIVPYPLDYTITGRSDDYFSIK